MKVNLDPETGARDEELASPPPDLSGFAYSGPSLESTQVASQRVQDVILAALRGALPRSRPLRAWEPQKLNSRHIAMCCDRAAGMTAGEISRKYQMAQTYVTAILVHPDSIIIIGAIQSLNADKMTDINARMQGYAHEMLTMKVDIARTTADNRLKDSIASDLLDRAGYGARRQIDLNALHRFAVPSAQAGMIATALDEDKRVATVDYTQFTQRKLSDGALEGGAFASSPQNEPLPVASASPGLPSATSAEEQVA